MKENDMLDVLPEEEDLRLDRVLARLRPELGLRGRRRLCGTGCVLVNGRPAPEGRKMKAGDRVEIRDAAPESDACPSAASPFLYPADAPRIIGREDAEGLLFLHKPAGLHTEPLAGRPGPSLADELAGMPSPGSGFPRLVNRLDRPTSGIVTAAADSRGLAFYQDAQDAGRTEKCYLALLEGSLRADVLEKGRLLMKDRERVLVELTPHADRRRHTYISPLAVLKGAALPAEIRAFFPCSQTPAAVTLAGCTILKGARHQIRAHAAAAGFPLLGDRRYGASCVPPEDAEEAFFLHHALLVLPGCRAVDIPAWLPLLGADAEASARRWLGLSAR